MASVKLTKSIRDKIVSLVIKQKYEPLEKALKAKEIKLAHKIYDLYFSKAERKIINSLPEGWLPTDDDVRVRVSGYTRISFSFGKDENDKSIYKRFTHKDGSYIDSEVGSKIYNLAHDFMNEKDDLEKEKRETKRSAEALIGSVTTVNKALEVWPAAETFIKEAVGVVGQQQKSNAPLPVVIVEDLNKKLGLPPKKAA